MQTVSADSGVPEPTPEDFGTANSLKRSSLNIEAVEEFSQNMAENIIQLFMSQMEMVEPRMPAFNEDREMLAEKLASAVIEIALREVRRGRNVEDQTSRSAGVKMDHEMVENPSFVDKSGKEKDLLDTDTEMDPAGELQTSRDTRPYYPPLSQSGLPVVGSLDYPDAPPTTPLLPELEKSRQSFTRKLKGGLAKVFLPSPPPPTPKDREDNSGGPINDPRVELMEYLMHSLSTDDLVEGGLEGRPQWGANMEAFAEALACDIMDWVLRAKNREQIAADSDLHRLAQQLAESIITSSLDESKMLV
ncbi:uncharacterized protein [Brachyistius frenatus]|uniref:uncharacterized protein n=1 Tax=Brachyistius frenatus TaxID=100188 RepID=UPI0037E7BE95